MINLLMFLTLSIFDTEIYAHRGASTIAPEHTLSAYDKAIEYGADYIELDLRMTKDNEVVVLHDNTVDRTTDGEGEINNLTLKQVKKLDAGSWFLSKYKDEKIPTLSEVFEEYGNDVNYYLETREIDGETLMEKEVLRAISEYNIDNQNIMFQSLSEESLKNIGDEYKRIKLFNKPFSQIDLEQVKSYADGIGNEANHYNFKSVMNMKLNGLETHAFFFGDEKKMTRKMILLGVDGIFTNYVQDCH